VASTQKEELASPLGVKATRWLEPEQMLEASSRHPPVWGERRHDAGEWWARFFADADRAVLAPLTSGALRLVFNDLRRRWTAATKAVPLNMRRENHFAYQEIIGLGEPALPLILEALEQEPDDWFWALAAIARLDPAHGVSDAEEAARRWLEWGRNEGLLGDDP
jgi:hypothetical protein